MNDNPWEDIYHRDGHVFTDILHVIPKFAKLIEQNGLIGGRLLDVGCGNGRHLVYFSQRRYSVIGFDSSPSAIRLSREWLAHEYPVLKKDCRIICLHRKSLGYVFLPSKFFP